MNSELNEVEINGITYVKKGTEPTFAINTDGLDYTIIRTSSAGVFAGYLEKKDGREITLLNARRLWFWSGAASLSQLAIEGVKNPDKCKFPCEVSEVVLLEAVEIIKCTEEARKSIARVPVWKK